MSSRRDSNVRLAYSTGGETEEGSPPQAESRPSRAGGIRLRLDRRASGRLVTMISGLPGTDDEVAMTARRLKTACGTGGTVDENGVLELQGDQRERVEAILRGLGLRRKRAGG